MKVGIQQTQYEHVADALGDSISEILKPEPSVRLYDFPNFSHLTGGFRPKEFTILCGSTGTGKTTLLANWSNSLVGQEVPHFVASVETGRHDFVRRIISARVQKDWNTGDLVSVQEVKKYLTEPEIERLKKARLYLSLYENRFSISQLLHDLDYMVKTHGVKVAFIDNLNFFMEVTSHENAIVEMDRVIHELIIYCKQSPVHVVMVMHPKKTFSGRVESEFDIKGSSTSVQEAQNVMLFNRPSEEIVEKGIAEPNDREILIAKMRRRGVAVGTRMILKSYDGVAYQEGPLLCRNKANFVGSQSVNPLTGLKGNSTQTISAGFTSGPMTSMITPGPKRSTDSKKPSNW